MTEDTENLSVLNGGTWKPLVVKGHKAVAGEIGKAILCKDFGKFLEDTGRLYGMRGCQSKKRCASHV